MKKLLLSTMLVAATVGGFSQSGMSKTLAGQSDWLVRKIAADTPYCTLARQFEADAVLTLAKNARGEGTVALDFQRDAFDVTRPYPVTLQVGNVSRNYAVKPAVPNVIILRVGADPSLFQAMTNNSVLNVTIDNEVFAMDLSGYTSGFSDLNKCLGIKTSQPQAAQAPQAPASPQPAPVTPPQMSVEQTARMESLLEENKRLTQELMQRDRQQQQMLQQQAQADQSQETRQLVQRLEESEQKNAQLLAQIQQLETDLRTSRQSLNPDMTQAMQERDQQIARLTQQNQALKDSLEAAQAQLAAAASSSDEASVALREQLAEMETRVATYKAERDAYQRELSAASNSSDAQVTELRNRVAELQGRIETANAERSRYQQQLQNASTSSDEQVNALRSQMAEMEQQISTYKAERDAYQQQLSTAASSSDEQLNELRNRVAELQGRIETANAERNRYQQQLQESSSSDQAVANLQGQMKDMEDQIAAYKAERNQYQQQLQQKTKELAQLQNREPEVIVKEVVKEIPAVKPDMVSSDSAISERLAEAETQAQALKAERDEYRRLLQQERLRTKTANDTGQTDNNSNMVAELEALEAEKAELARQLAYAKSTAPAFSAPDSQAQQEIDRLTKSLNVAQAKLADVNNRAEQLESQLTQAKLAPASGDASPRSGNEDLLQARLKDMESQLTRMTAEKAAMQEKLQSYETASTTGSDNQSQKREMMEARLQDMEEMVERANNEKARLETQLQSVRADLDNTSAQTQEYDLVVARLQDMEDKANRLAEEKKLIEGQLADAQNVDTQGGRQQEQQMNALRKQMSKLQSQVAMLNEEKAKLNQELVAAQQASRQDNSQQTRVKMAQANQRVQEMEQRLADMAQENERLQQQVAIEQQKAQNTTKQMAQAAVAKLSTGNAQSQAEIKTLQSELAALEAQNSVLRQDVNRYKQSSQEQAKAAMVQSQQQAEAEAQRRRSVPVVSQPQSAQAGAAVQARQQAMLPLTGDEIKEMVAQANVPLVSNIDRIDRVSGPDFAAFRWDTGTVYGSGELSRMSNVSAFDSSVRQYINKTRSRCVGSFDQTVADKVVDGVNVKIADIACVDENANGVAASILFFVHDGMFYALAHEADMDTFQTAMDMRDRLTGSIGTIF